jgi:organic hydroperoxide reductase OsmC/OhrA
MADYHADVTWERGTQDFASRRYSRAHRWRFDGGAEVPASASPHIVPLPWSDPAGVDPEEAFVAALASCHMLFFLQFASEGGFVVDRYHDAAVGTLARGAGGRHVMTQVVLRPAATFSGERRPTPAELEALHHRAHEECFIANSVRTEIVVRAD